MKESGINWAYGVLNLDTGLFDVFYVYENNAGLSVTSVSGAQTGFSGTLSSMATFWQSPGSGFFSGTTLSVNNASGADSLSWTKLFVYEQTRTGGLILFDSLGGGSGHRIGVTDSNKLYFESYNGAPVVAAGLTNLSSKNMVAVSYLTNHVTLDYYNINSQLIESEAFSYPFAVTRSDNWILGGGAPYYSDYFVSIRSYLGPDVIGQLCSGFYARPTGYIYPTTTICVTGVTGYQNVFVGETGVTGYQITPGGDEGQWIFTGAFPLYHTTVALTGHLNSGLYASGITGLSCTTTTGAPILGMEYQSGYASGFGMTKTQLFTPLISTDIVKAGYSNIPFYDIYNIDTQSQYSGFLMPNAYDSGLLDVFYNGIAQAGSGWALTGNYIFVSGAQVADTITLDLKSGSKTSYVVGTGLTFTFPFSGQEIYLNGVNLVSGYDYTVAGTTLTLAARNSGIGGTIFEYPIVLSSITGRFTVQITQPYWRNTSNIYLNGVRQQEYALYIEGGAFDLLSGQQFDYSGISTIYDNTDLFWE